MSENLRDTENNMTLTGELRHSSKYRVNEPVPAIDTNHLLRLLSSAKGITEAEIKQAETLDELEAARVSYDETLICHHPFVKKSCCVYCFAHIPASQLP